MKRLDIHTLEKGWAERDELILHAAFQVLVDFMVKEKPGKAVDWEGTSPDAGKAWGEMKALYRWWTKKRPTRKDPLDDDRIKCPCLSETDLDKKEYAAWHRACEKHDKLEKQWSEEDQASLHRLIEIRGYMWT